MSKLIASVVTLAMCLTAINGPAYAYLDPGTGSMLLQGLVGGIAAGAAVISLNYQRLKSAILERFGKGPGKADK